MKKQKMKDGQTRNKEYLDAENKKFDGGLPH